MAATAPPPPQATSAPNALFLIAFGMFLAAAVIPALLSALVRTVVLLAVASVACIVTNPTDHSFACWVSEQEDIDLRLKKEKPGVKQWLSAVVKTAIAMVTQDPLTWTYYNVVLFSVVFVPSLNRYAFGCGGYWWWADQNPRLLPICKAKWIPKLARGGSPSGIAEYMDEDSAEQRRQLKRQATRHESSRLRRQGGDFDEVADALSTSIGELANTLQTSLSGGSFGPESRGVHSGLRLAGDDSTTATGSFDRALRAIAIKAKISKDWKEAAKQFMEASRVALSLLSRTNYKMEAVWCEIEIAAAFPSRSSRLLKMVDDVCEELSSAGFFDDASRALSELALRLKKKFPQDSQQEAAAQQLGELHLRARVIAEAGNNARSAIENCVLAACVYAEASLWRPAEETFEAVAKLLLRENRLSAANEQFGNAVLCRIGQLDVLGADQLHQLHRRLLLKSPGVTEDSNINKLLASIFESFDRGSASHLSAAIKAFQARQQMQPWQLKCVANAHHMIPTSDLR